MQLSKGVLGFIIAAITLLQQSLVWMLPVDGAVELKSPVLPPVEWFGGPRGGDPNDEAFHDVSYDDSVCPAGLRSSGLRNYAYIGSVIKTIKNSNNTDDCVRQCFLNLECKSINAYVKRKHSCELNSDDQFGDPTKLISVTNSVYYDRIHCGDSSTRP